MEDSHELLSIVHGSGDQLSTKTVLCNFKGIIVLKPSLEEMLYI